MNLSASDIVQLKALRELLTRSFAGASFGAWKIDDMNGALSRAIQAAEVHQQECGK